MTFVIIIFFISITVALGMLYFRVWKIKTKRIENPGAQEFILPKIQFRHLEKNMLYLTKHILQGLLFTFVKYWFIVVTKVKKWFNSKWPKISSFFKRKKTNQNISYRHSFVKKAVLESKARIKHIREKVKEEIESKEEKSDKLDN